VLCLALWAGLGHAGQAAGSATLTIQTDRPTVAISSNLFGIFFEEINHAGDGGLYAEMVRNRSFEELDNTAAWQLVTTGGGAGTMAVDATVPLNGNNPSSLRLEQTSAAGTLGAANAGFWGMNFQAGHTYDLTLWARGQSVAGGALVARLENAAGSQVLAQTAVNGLTTSWNKFAVSLTPSATATNGRLVIALATPGTVWLDMVSLFPRNTFRGRPNGLHAGLAGLLEDLRPAFMRFPGGCWVEGTWMTNAYRWKHTIGPLESRLTKTNLWGYFSNNGLGYHEYLQLCEDIGAAPLFVINCGMSHNDVIPLADMAEYVQDALDAIEYANGPTNSTWGALRAANGHPAPFNLKYLQVGNENGGANYNDRYALFYDAVKAAYPEIKIIACVWGGTPGSRPLEIIDEHYYNTASFFIGNATKYDTYSRRGPKIYVGEFAVTSGGGQGNLMGALGEAAFMTGLERNSDIVEMSSYAPLFANVNDLKWVPDLIYYDSSQLAPTPSYYVQKLFAQHRGDAVLPSALTITGAATNPPPHGAVGLGSWSTSVQYTNVVVTSNGVTLYQSDFANQGTNGWRVYNGAWSVNAGLYRQTSASTTDCRSTVGDTNWANYTLSLRARKVSGSEGFLILFNWVDDNNWTWLNLGGWGNAQHGIEQCVNGTKTTLGTRSAGSIQTNQWYDISIVLTGSRIQCYLDGSLIQDVTYPTTVTSGLITSTSYQKASGEIIVKAVNPYTAPMTTTLTLTGLAGVSSNATLIQLVSSNPTAANSVSNPTNVVPVMSTIGNASTNFAVSFPPNSLSILRLQGVGVRCLSDLQIQVPSPINGGETVTPAAWGRFNGEMNWVNLGGDTNYPIQFSSANPDIAGVDANGNVTGIRSGTTSIIATYPALGLTATQAVQVVGTPTALVHRYRFNEATGTTVTDDIGGPAWDGILPKGGLFGGGQLSLAAASQQYVQFPAGILSNYTMITLDSWVTFPGQLPVNCFYFGFGNTSGGAGYNYAFCAPRAGRIAITDGTWSGEQNASGAGDLSFRTNLHLTAVFNPPASRVAFYTNGVLAALNTNVTAALSSVNDIYCYLAKSLYSGDPYPDLILDEFRIYNGALSPQEITASQALGPDVLLSTTGPALTVVLADKNLTLSWPAASAGFGLETRTNLVSGAWAPVAVPPQLGGSSWQVTVPVTGNEQYFRLQR
jgi:alpha-L-arabinofuranosidase